MMTIPVIEPYRAYIYFNTLNEFKIKLDAIILKLKVNVIDVSDIVKAISKTLDQIYLPYFVVEFGKWSDESESSGLSYSDYFISNGEWRKELRNIPDYIFNLGKVICNDTLINIEEALTRLQFDRLLINGFFGMRVENSKIIMEVMDGDRHENGKQPILFRINDNKLIYKPRRSGTEDVINKICIAIDFYSICPRSLDRNGYLWQEYIERGVLSDKGRFGEAYKNYGVVLAIATLLNLNDCHFDNFIVNESRVILIDSETCFQCYDGDIEPSVLQTGLLQSHNAIVDGMGHTAAITAVSNIFTSFSYPYAIHDKTKKIQVKYEQAYLEEKKNYPRTPDVVPIPNEYILDILNGFESGYERLTANSRRVISIIESTRNIKSRYLVRATAYYLYVINKMLLPNGFYNAKDNKCAFLDRFLAYDEAKSQSVLIDYELGCLMKYDVPIFYTSPFSRNIVNGNGEVINDFFSICAFEKIKFSLKYSKEYLDKQKKLIENCMRGYQ